MKKYQRFIFASVFGFFIYILCLITTGMISLAVINSSLLSIILDKYLLVKI